MRIPLQIILPLILVAAVPAFAENGPPAAPQRPAPAAAEQSAGAGRIEFVSGNVAVYQLGQTDWTRAEAGSSLGSGAWVATDPKGRAELRIGPASVAIAGDTELSLANLQPKVMEVALSRGRLEVQLRQLAEGVSEQIDLPGGALQLTEPGSYEVAAGARGPSRIAVFEGTARFTGGGLDQTITAGNALVLNGAGEKRSASVEAARPDEFARWSRSRADRQQPVTAAQPAPPPASGTTEAEQSARPQQETTQAERAVHYGRHARRERHRRIVRHHYARHYYHHPHYGYAVAGPPVPNPFAVIGGLLGIR